MRVVAFDPFLTPERAVEIGVEKAELDDVLARADFITLHTPLTDKTRDIIDAGRWLKPRRACASSIARAADLIDEKDLKEALDSGHVAGAALDVFEEEPAKDNALFNMENVVCTPHLGASTSEAQENVALQVAEQMADYLMTGAVTNAINMPSISAEDAPRLRPYVALAEQLGLFAGQLTESGIEGAEIEYVGDVSELKPRRSPRPLWPVCCARFWPTSIWCRHPRSQRAWHHRVGSEAATRPVRLTAIFA